MSTPTKPSFISIGDVGRYVSVIWRSDSSLKGVNVYRNGRYVTSVNMPNNVFNDYSGKMGDRYYLIGYDKNKKFSDRSPEQRPVGVPTSVTSVRWHTTVIQVKWNKPNGAKSFEVYKNNRLIARTSNTAFVDKNARGNSSYTIKVIDRYGNRGPASQKARQPSRITARNGQPVTTGQTQPFTQQLTGNREFRGTMTVDANTGISMEGNVYDNAGNNLGSVSQSHNGSLVETWARPKYDPNGSHYVLRMDADPMELAPGSTLEKLASFFRSKPPTPSGGGGGGGGGSGGNGGRQTSGAPGVEFDDNGYPQGDHAGP